jgi:hypothetical protein
MDGTWTGFAPLRPSTKHANTKIKKGNLCIRENELRIAETSICAQIMQEVDTAPACLANLLYRLNTLHESVLPCMAFGFLPLEGERGCPCARP